MVSIHKTIEALDPLIKRICDDLVGAEYDAPALREFILPFGNAIVDIG